jgi:glycosyltransferase involved in cell wall biosynthesis
LARALCDLGHEITVYSGDSPIQRDLGGSDIRIRTFPFTDREKVPNLGSRFRKIVERWSFSRQALPEVASANHDWVILTKPFDFFWPWRMPENSLTRFAFMSGGTDFYWGDRFLARRIDAWLACSHFNAWQIQHRYKRFPQVMYNGVDLSRFVPRARDMERRRELGFGDADIVFAYAGRLVGWKGLSVAIRALAEPALRDQSARLLIIGQGDELPRLQGLARSLGAANRIVFHPPVSHDALPALYALSDAGIFPSIGDEAFGITIAEAMACGLPVLASYVGGIPEVVGNEGRCGLLVAPGHVKDWAEQMARLILHPAERAALGQAARERVAAHFSWTHAARRLLDGLPA